MNGQVRNWEKRLQHMASETNVDKLVANADKHIKKYQEKLPKKAGKTRIEMHRFNCKIQFL